MGFNYVLVFSPHPLASAPHSLAATITMPPDRDAPVTQALLRTFPGVSVVAVGDIVSQVGELLGQMSSAIVAAARSEEHTSELQSLMRISYAVFCLKKKTYIHN